MDPRASQYSRNTSSSASGRTSLSGSDGHSCPGISRRWRPVIRKWRSCTSMTRFPASSGQDNACCSGTVRSRSRMTCIDARENAQVPAVLDPAILRLGRESQATARRCRRGEARTAVPRRPTGAGSRARNVRVLECGGISACGGAGAALADGRSSRAGDPHSGQGDGASEHLGDVPDRRSGRGTRPV